MTFERTNTLIRFDTNPYQEKSVEEMVAAVKSLENKQSDGQLLTIYEDAKLKALRENLTKYLRVVLHVVDECFETPLKELESKQIMTNEEKQKAECLKRYSNEFSKITKNAEGVIGKLD